METIGDKTIVVSGEGDFIYFDTNNFNSDKLLQKRLPSDLKQFLEKKTPVIRPTGVFNIQII